MSNASPKEETRKEKLERAYLASLALKKKLEHEVYMLQFEFPDTPKGREDRDRLDLRNKPTDLYGLSWETHYYTESAWLRMIRKNLKEIQSLRHRKNFHESEEHQASVRDDVWQEFGINLG